MKKLYRIALTLLAALFTLAFATAIRAQEEEAPRIGYYLAADANSIQQVYQLLMDGASEARQITHSNSDVITFGAAHDGLSVAYMSDTQLWLQPIHTEEPEALVTISATQFFAAPVFSADDQTIAYTNDGVWLLDLATRTSYQILPNVELKEDAITTGEFHFYKPEAFVLDAEGKAARLIVDVGVWEWDTRGVYEWYTVGVYDLVSTQLQEFAVKDNTSISLLPLSDGRVLFYSNSDFTGESALYVADTLDDINAYTKVLDFAGITDGSLSAAQVIEVLPGVARVVGSVIDPSPLSTQRLFGPAVDPSTVSTQSVFHFNYDVSAGTATDVQFIPLMDMTQVIESARLSPDGRLMPVYANAIHNSMGIMMFGELKFIDLVAGAVVTIDVPKSVSGFVWQP